MTGEIIFKQINQRILLFLLELIERSWQYALMQPYDGQVGFDAALNII